MPTWNGTRRRSRQRRGYAFCIRSASSWGGYRTAGGAEIDLVVDMGAGEVWAVEIERSTASSLSRGFLSACEDLKPKRKLVVHGGDESFPLAKDVEAVALSRIAEP